MEKAFNTPTTAGGIFVDLLSDMAPKGNKGKKCKRKHKRMPSIVKGARNWDHNVWRDVW